MNRTPAPPNLVKVIIQGKNPHQIPLRADLIGDLTLDCVLNFDFLESRLMPDTKKIESVRHAIPGSQRTAYLLFTVQPM